MINAIQYKPKVYPKPPHFLESHWDLRNSGKDPGEPKIKWAPEFSIQQHSENILNQIHQQHVKSASSLFILLVPTINKDPFWQRVILGARMSALDQEINLKIVAPKTPGNIDEQEILLKHYIKKSPTAIITTCSCQKRIFPLLEKAQKSGIHITIFHSRKYQENQLSQELLPTIGVDDFALAQTAAQKGLSFGMKHSAAMLCSIHNHSVQKTIFNGINSITKPLNINLSLIDINAKDLKTYKDFDLNYDSLFLAGASANQLFYEAVMNNKIRKGKYSFIGSFDKLPQTQNLLKKRYINMIFDSRPFLQGYLSISRLDQTKRIKPKIIASSLRQPSPNLRNAFISD